ncbi:glycosyltransferase family 2 protein [Chryseobacterium sp. R2A-55]|uniref:glycosyltransferase family 2 protein n=1 Tax=Chryseobacterium sp. R2A-55 TaxID=2744445 RepID=UPI001F3AF752|nr:glycosyltransferase [Chryseobacterium sp. R2A-55]
MSVIIPVFNTAIYLRDCLESILAQSFHDFEIICINDGSTDMSLQVLKDFAEKDPRIVVIDQNNQGVSAARNAGLEMATGKYVGFVDGDDTIEKDFILKLFQKAEESEADAVYTRLTRNHHFGRFTNVIDRQEIVDDLLPLFFWQDNFNSVCIKIFRLEIIREHQIRFPSGTQHGEDAQFNIEFLMKAQRISILDYCGYHYREVEGSATRNIVKYDYLQRIVEVYETDWTTIIGNAIDQNTLGNLKRIRFINAVISLVYIYGNRGNDFTDAQRFSKLREIVQHPTVKKVFSDHQILRELKLGKYPATIFHHLRKQNVLMLYLLTQYSYYRNR